MSNNDAQILEQLRRATAGVLFMSESDYPFEVIQWEGLTAPTHEFIRSLTNESADCEIQELELENFLAGGKYQNIVKVFTTNLSHHKVYKVGRINMPAYVVGRSSSGKWLGVSTRVVET